MSDHLLMNIPIQNETSFSKEIFYLNNMSKFNVIIFQGHIYDQGSNEIGQARRYWVETANALPSSSPHCPFRLLIWN